MDLFKFQDGNINLVSGQPINNYDSVMWIERYDKAGEFEITAKLSSGIVGFLPPGTIISHTKTYEACIVENIEISESSSMDPTVKISGRGLISYFDYRIVGLSLAEAETPTIPPTQYELAANNLQTQIMNLINSEIGTLEGYIICTTQALTLPQDARIVKRQSVYEAALELLSLGNLGIRVVRKNYLGAVNALSATKSLIYIYRGNDLSSSVIFSWESGELESASYLLSNKTYRNVALVQGTYTEAVVYDNSLPEDAYGKRVMLVDASDIDKSLVYVPTGSELTDILNALQARGYEALANQNILNLSNVDLAKSTSYKYRTNYNLGDIVSISGNYGVIEKRRVVEYVEIEDETGETGYPTLSAV
jgi:hypothetical protein